MDYILLSTISTLLIIAHLIGGVLIARGVITLLKGLHGKGQSTQGIDDLRTALIKLFTPLLVGIIAIASLLILTYWERSPFSVWIQGIAPVSTLIWVLWGHFTSKEVQSGEMFEALFPLGEKMSDKQVISLAEAWAKKGHSLNPKSIVRTAIKAIDDNSVDQKKRVNIDELASILRETFHELHMVLKKFPLAQRLTLADWIFEGERLADIWGEGLQSIERGRQFINPYTLVDQKIFWKWSSAQPKDLFEAELSTWLHRGVYLLVVRRWRNLDQEEPISVVEAEQIVINRPKETPTLWKIMSRKLTVPFWLYWCLCSIAMVVSHGLYGGALSLIAGLFLLWSLHQVSSITKWRDCLADLGTLPRERHEAMTQQKTMSEKQLEDQIDTFNETFMDLPAQSTLTLMRSGFVVIAETHRRPEQPQVPLALCNASLTDATLSVQYICDDFIEWRTEDNLISMVLTLANTLGSKVANLDQKLLESVRDWASEEQAGDNGESTGIAVNHQAHQIDQWLSQQLKEAGFFKRTGLEATLQILKSSIRERVSKELKTRILPLYQSEVENP